MLDCPKCREASLEPAQSDLIHGQAMSCRTCGGMWVEQSDATVSDEAPPLPPSNPIHDRDADLRAGLCPRGHGILRRAATHADPPFYLERCSSCGGIWFDRGEVELVVAQGLTSGLLEIWEPSWQRDVMEARREGALVEHVEDALGKAVFEEVVQLGKKLRGHPMRSRAVSFLIEVITGRARV